MNRSKKDQIRIGIDLGGTKIEMIALDHFGDVLKQQRIQTPVGEYEKTIKSIARLVLDFEKDFNIKASVGVGMPGAISPVTGKVKNSNSICLNSKPFKQDLESVLNRLIRIENDANCFALSEAKDGAAAGENIVFGVILGTGVGGGLVINGELISGPNAISGEWGHNPLPWPDEKEFMDAAGCYCGKKGCIETWLNGEGLSRTFYDLTAQDCSPSEIAIRADMADKQALKVLNQYAIRLAKSLSSVINILDPEVIVLGGGLSNINRIYSLVPELWHEYIFSDRVDTRLVPAKFGDASGVRGAAWLW